MIAIVEFLLKLVLFDLAKLEGQIPTNPFREKIENFGEEAQADVKYLREYIEPDSLTQLLTLLCYLVPQWEKMGNRLEAFTFYQDQFATEDWAALQRQLQLFAADDRQWREKMQGPVDNKVLYLGIWELTRAADDRINPSSIEKYLGQLFPHGAARMLRQYQKLQQNLAATVLIGQKKYLLPHDQYYYRLRVAPLKERQINGKRPAKGTAYADELSAWARGTGFFMQFEAGAGHCRHIVTAKHLFYDEDEKTGEDLTYQPQDFYYVKGYHAELPTIKCPSADQEEASWVLIPRRNVFFSKAKESRYEYDGSSEDWTYFEIEPNEITNDYALDWTTPAPSDTPLNRKELVYGVGHGLGLPQKFHFDGRINYAKHPKHFQCCLDFFSGNSGSPVFNAQHEVVGILGSGKGDFRIENAKLATNFRQCLPRDTEGERCQRIQLLLDDYDQQNASQKEETPLPSAGIRVQRNNQPMVVPRPERTYAPYLFLTEDNAEDDADQLLAFVMVPLPIGQSLGAASCSQRGKVTRIKYRVRGIATSGQGNYYAYDVQKVPCSGTYDPGGAVKVIVRYGTKEQVFFAHIRFDDRDVSRAYTYDSADPVAENAPYLYLTNPEQKGDYYPRLLLPLRGYEKTTPAPSHGNDRRISINLRATGGTTRTVLNDFDFYDQSPYQQTENGVELGLKIIVNLPGAALNNRDRKAKIRRANSDEKPTDFDQR